MSLPKPPSRTAFHTDRDGNYRHTVMPADLRLTGKFDITGTNCPDGLNFSAKPRENSEKAD